MLVHSCQKVPLARGSLALMLGHRFLDSRFIHRGCRYVDRLAYLGLGVSWRWLRRWQAVLVAAAGYSTARPKWRGSSGRAGPAPGAVERRGLVLGPGGCTWLDLNRFTVLVCVVARFPSSCRHWHLPRAGAGRRALKRTGVGGYVHVLAATATCAMASTAVSCIRTYAWLPASAVATARSISRVAATRARPI